MHRHVSLITLGVRDLDRARSFYEALGWAGASPDGEVVFIQVGPLVLALWDRALAAADAVTVDGGGWGGITLAHNVSSPAEVDAVLAEAAAAGATIARLGAPTDWGGYGGVFHDPEGHAWGVAHNPYWRLDADGGVHLPETDQ
ncbi:MAG: hypothetical protein KDB02_11925 [Acidimicrobiales bacterium]|nr:hypothetical protein [Acidimicrobiales bacterium]